MGVRRAIVIGGLILAALLAAVPAAYAYTIPPDNPFVSTPGARAEIFVYGMRNPFRWSFDRATGDMWIGDVGGGEWEEVNRLPAGAIAGRNLGWSCREGLVKGPRDCSAPGAVDPVHQYATSAAGSQAVVGGYVVRDPSLPAWQGRYLFGDAFETAVKWLDPAAPATANDTGVDVDGLSGFGEDGLGRLYATSRSSGNVYRFQQDGAGALGLAPIGPTFNQPVAAFGPLGDPDQLFVVELGGTLKLRAGGAVHDFLTVLTTAGGERGFLSATVAPDYATSGRVFVFYTAPNGDLQLDEFRRSATNPFKADPASRIPMLTIPHPEGNHNGGQLLFGPDGNLYLSTGDGGGQGDPNNNAQRLDSLLGKVLRVDVRPPAGEALPPPPAPDVRAPALRRSAKGRQRVLKLGGIVAYARCDEICRVTADGTLRIGKRGYPLRGQSKAAGAGQRVRLEVRLTKKARKALKKALARGRHPVVRVSLRARDAAGNLGSLQRATVRVRR